VLALVEVVQVGDLEAEVVNPLLYIGVPCLCLGAKHLQRDETLLGLLLDLGDTMLDTWALAIDFVAEPSLHLLKLLEHHTEVGIYGFLRFLATVVVVGVWLNRIKWIWYQILGTGVELGEVAENLGYEKIAELRRNDYNWILLQLFGYPSLSPRHGL
jgi:hypothetical protein